MAESSPMIEQYRRIKSDHREEVLFFRLGDFYEMFAEDALEVSSLLNLTLTSRNGLPMCGIPYHAARTYIARLLRHGKKIAICEQAAKPGVGKGIIERRVVEVITPGTIVDEEYLDQGNSNYLCALAALGSKASFAYIDLSTGTFCATSFPLDGGNERLRRELERLDAREIILQESLLEGWEGLDRAIQDRSTMVVNRWADWLFDLKRSRSRLERQFGTANLRGFGFSDEDPPIVAAGALLDYLDDTAKSLLPHVRSIHLYGDDDYVGIDEATQKNLELVRNLRDGEERFSLLEVMDETKTSMGKRLLKWRILHPLRDLERIGKRLDMVEALYRNQSGLASLRETLGKSPDLERLCSRVAMDRAHGKDLWSLKIALYVYEKVLEFMDAAGNVFLGTDGFADPEEKAQLRSLRGLLEKGLQEDPSTLLTEGNLIRQGYNAELDGLRNLRENGRGLLEAYLEEERSSTGIGSLKIRYNRLIGYFFEVTKAQLPSVPAHFIRRQGVVGGERYTTDKLASLESDLNGASDKIVELERRLFVDLRDSAKALIPALLNAAGRVADLDVAQSLARAATLRAWVRPEIVETPVLLVAEGRHPVVEAHLPRGEFIPNDIDLDTSGISFALITGPNMAGKSTYLRQAALVSIMAQTGSFVPALEARIGLADRVFCRVGASDNLARGESTFLVEMNETANILHSATLSSLVIMDEVGRGTGTKDGLAIAWAVCEELLNGIGCRTLFATHYHELSRIVHSKLANRSMEVADQGGQILFLKKLKEGATEESYGLHVAKLAGLPARVVERADSLMGSMQDQGAVFESGPEPALPPQAMMAPFQASPSVPPILESRFLEDLRSIDTDRMTPLEALNHIHAWKHELINGSRRNSRPAKKSQGPSLFD